MSPYLSSLSRPLVQSLCHPLAAFVQGCLLQKVPGTEQRRYGYGSVTGKHKGVLVEFHVQVQVEVEVQLKVWAKDCGQLQVQMEERKKIRCRNKLQQYLVLVLHSNKGPGIYELLSDVNVSPEAGVVHCRVAVLIHKVHVRLVS